MVALCDRKCDEVAGGAGLLVDVDGPGCREWSTGGGRRCGRSLTTGGGRTTRFNGGATASVPAARGRVTGGFPGTGPGAP
jgi:hypothetical protein